MYFIWTRKGGQDPWEKIDFAFSKVEHADHAAVWVRTDEPSRDVAVLPADSAPLKLMYPVNKA